MAKVSRIDGSKVRGKDNKKSDLVHRTRNGVEYAYHMNPYQGPPSKAQKEHRAHHGKITSVINAMLADPLQVRELTEQMEQYNRSLLPNSGLRCRSVRQFAYRMVDAQLKQQNPPKQRKFDAKTPLPRGITLHIKPFAELDAAELYEILKSRFSVFVIEQGIRYLDEDGIDLTATHVALHRKGQVVAYARLFDDYSDARTYDEAIHNLPAQHVIRVGRMLTTEHGKGFGRILMMHIIAEAKRQGADILRLHAQTQAVPFYKHFRFRAVGEPFLEADIPHILMERRLTRARRK